MKPSEVWVPHDCTLCPKKRLVGLHYLNHLRFAHPAQFDNWMCSKTEFGFSAVSHFYVEHGDDRIRR